MERAALIFTLIASVGCRGSIGTAIATGTADLLIEPASDDGFYIQLTDVPIRIIDHYNTQTDTYEDRNVLFTKEIEFEHPCVEGSLTIGINLWARPRISFIDSATPAFMVFEDLDVPPPSYDDEGVAIDTMSLSEECFGPEPVEHTIEFAWELDPDSWEIYRDPFVPKLGGSWR